MFTIRPSKPVRTITSGYVLQLVDVVSGHRLGYLREQGEGSSVAAYNDREEAELVQRNGNRWAKDFRYELVDAATVEGGIE